MRSTAFFKGHKNTSEDRYLENRTRVPEAAQETSKNDAAAREKFLLKGLAEQHVNPSVEEFKNKSSERRVEHSEEKVPLPNVCPAPPRLISS